MIKKLFPILSMLILSVLTGCAQQSTLIANKIQIKDSLKIGGKWYKKFPDSLVGVSDTTALMRKANNLNDLTNVPAARAVLQVDNVDNTSDADKNGATAELFNKTMNGNNNTFLNIPFSALLGVVPLTRTITINGVTYDLSANRSWTVEAGTGGVSNFAALADVNVVGVLNKQMTRWDSLNAKWGAFTPNLNDVTLWTGYKPLSKTDTLNGATNIFLNVPFSAITGKPNNLAAYGIVDAVPNGRTITINGSALDLSANRSWTIPVGSTTLSGLTDATITSPTIGQVLQHNGSKWVNFTPNITYITLWAGYKPFGPADTTTFLVTQTDLADSLGQVDSLHLARPLYAIKGADGRDTFAVKNDSAAWNAKAIRDIPINVTAPSDGQALAFDLASNTYKPKTILGTGSYTFPNSVQNSSGSVGLVGDVSAPGNWYIYSTNGSGTKQYNSFTGFPITTSGANGLFSSGYKARVDSGLTIANRRVLGADSLLYAIISGTAGVRDSLYARALQLLAGYGMQIDDSSTQAVIKKFFRVDTSHITTRDWDQKGRDSLWKALTLKANLASPALTGIPTVPTATAGTNTTQAASTAFVQAAVSALSTGVSSFSGRTGAITPASGDYTVSQVTGAAPLASPALTGTPTVPTATGGTNTTQAASTAFVQSAVSTATSGLAPLASPTFTGSPAVPTAAPGTNTAQAASTAFVQAAVSAATTGVSSFNGRTGAVAPASGDYTVSQVTGAAPLASPALTGTPTVPTATVGTNTTQAASTAFVQAAVSSGTSGLVSSFNGRSGAVTPASGDYAFSQVTGAAPLASPSLTGTPTVPTATAGTNNTQAASTAFVQSAISTGTSGLAPLASPALTGIPTVPTATAGTNTIQAASTAFVQAAVSSGTSGLVSSFNGRSGAVTPASGDYTVSQVTGAAPLASPSLTGTPTVPTATAGTNTTQAASTAFVQAAVSSGTSGLVSSFNGRSGAVTPASGDYTVSQVTGAAPVTSPSLTGTPTVPTATAGTNTTQAASTAFVQAAVSGASITESKLSFSDITTANVSTSAHGLAPKLPGNSNLFFNGAGGYTDPLSAVNISSGAYTPTFSASSNTSGFTALKSTYIRVGAIVQYMIQGICTSTSANTRSSFFVSIPITSTFTTNDDVGGGGVIIFGTNTLPNDNASVSCAPGTQAHMIYVDWYNDQGASASVSFTLTGQYTIK